jgi:integrase/recombinase XerD
VAGYIAAAALGKEGSCHTWRHTTATLMLEGGADIHDIQELLGHDDLRSTQVYTRVSIQRLKEVHARTHPAGRDGTGTVD